MGTKLPRVIGLEDLLSLRKPLSERPGPLVYLSDREFSRLIKDATELKRRPPGGPLARFEPWPGGGMVQSRCESPEGQICFGQWTVGPAGGGVYFDCRCRMIGGGPVPPERTSCRLMLDPTTGFQCDGTCEFGTCRLGFYRDQTGSYTLDCRCRRL